MSKLIESRFYSVLITVSDYLLLGIVWILGCLPLVTITASNRAALATSLTWQKEGATGQILKNFLLNFKQHFGRSFLVNTFLISLLVVNHFNFEGFSQTGFDLKIWAVIMLVSSLVAFGLYASYLRQDLLGKNKFGETMKQAAIAFLMDLPKMLLLTFITLLFSALIFIFPLFLFIFAGAYWKLVALTLRTHKVEDFK